MAGYSQTSLVKKLGIKENFSIHLINSPEEYDDWIFPIPEGVKVAKKLKDELDFIHLFAKDEKSFQSAFVKAKDYLKKNGMLWVSWPKKASKIVTDLDESKVRDFGLQQGLVDVKVCAVSDIWSGLKFVIRLRDR